MVFYRRFGGVLGKVVPCSLRSCLARRVVGKWWISWGPSHCSRRSALRLIDGSAAGRESDGISQYGPSVPAPTLGISLLRRCSTEWEPQSCTSRSKPTMNMKSLVVELVAVPRPSFDKFLSSVLVFLMERRASTSDPVCSDFFRRACRSLGCYSGGLGVYGFCISR